jgi:hypothetical protein
MRCVRSSRTGHSWCTGRSRRREGRYTRCVGYWKMRAVSMAMAAVLAGSPAVAILCGVLCSADAHASTLARSTHSEGHHSVGPEASVPQTVTDPHDGAAPPERHGPGTNTGTSREPGGAHPRLYGLTTRHCSGSLAAPSVSLTAARTKATRAPAATDAVILTETLSDRCGLDRSGPARAAPPGGASPERTPLVLRV